MLLPTGSRLSLGYNQLSSAMDIGNIPSFAVIVLSPITSAPIRSAPTSTTHTAAEFQIRVLQTLSSSTVLYTLLARFTLGSPPRFLINFEIEKGPSWLLRHALFFRQARLRPLRVCSRVHNPVLHRTHRSTLVAVLICRLLKRHLPYIDLMQYF